MTVDLARVFLGVAGFSEADSRTIAVGEAIGPLGPSHVVFVLPHWRDREDWEARERELAAGEFNGAVVFHVSSRWRLD